MAAGDACSAAGHSGILQKMSAAICLCKQFTMFCDDGMMIACAQNLTHFVFSFFSCSMCSAQMFTTIPGPGDAVAETRYNAINK